MNRTIYIQDELGDEILKIAEDEGVSFSKALLSRFGHTISEMGQPGNKVTEQLDRIESMLNQLIPKGMPDSLRDGRLTPEIVEKATPIPQTPADRIRDKMDDEDFGNEGMSDDDPGGDGEDYDSDTEAQIIAEGQAKLDEARKGRKIKKEKIEIVKGLYPGEQEKWVTVERGRRGARNERGS